MKKKRNIKLLCGCKERESEYYFNFAILNDMNLQKYVERFFYERNAKVTIQWVKLVDIYVLDKFFLTMIDLLIFINHLFPSS
jgi:hypothetical protein